MNIVITAQTAADALDIAQTARDPLVRTYWTELATAANHGVLLINRLGATAGAEELENFIAWHRMYAEEKRAAGDLEADAWHRGRLAGYIGALTD